MPVQLYECMFILDTGKSGDLEHSKTTLHNVLNKRHATIEVSRKWEERKLAYPIKHARKGLYYLIYFRMDTKEMTTLKEDLHLVEMILRYQMIAVPPKWEAEMLAVAQDETRQALSCVTEHAPAEQEGDPELVGVGLALGLEGADRSGPRRGGSRRGGFDKDDR